ncbi:MAG: hypothetical protein Q8R38_07400 [Candidatus Omnitrophota bacterium]|nr:hypothetical protein [Candidatus Omnitrophota bacterium]
MKIKKIVIIAALIIALFTIVMLLVTNMLFLRNVAPYLSEPKEKPPAEQIQQMEYAIPTATTIRPTQDMEKLEERRKIAAERELEAEHTRNVNRAEAFAQQKALEASKQLAVGPIPRKEPKLPSEEEIKEMEKKGIISY